MTRLSKLTLAGAVLALSTAGALALDRTSVATSAEADAALAAAPVFPAPAADRLAASNVFEALNEGKAPAATGSDGAPIGRIEHVRIDDDGLGRYLIVLDPGLGLEVDRVTFRGPAEYDGDGGLILSVTQAEFVEVVRDILPMDG